MAVVQEGVVAEEAMEVVLTAREVEVVEADTTVVAEVS